MWGRLVVGMALILAGCSSEARLFSAEDGRVWVYFCPEDNCLEVLDGLFEIAHSSIHCAFFDLDEPALLEGLANRSKDIDVKLVIDGHNKPLVEGRGFVEIKYSKLSHNKFCIIDGQTVMTGSFNPTVGGRDSLNNVIVIESVGLSRNYDLEFSELWMGNFGKGHTTLEPVAYINGKQYASYFCPEDDCQGKVLDELMKAQHSVKFMTFSFTDHKIASLLVSLQQRGVAVSGIAEGQRKSMPFEQYPYLISQGVPLVFDNTSAIFHHKVFIIDDMTVVTGSYNPTSAGTSANDENVLIVHDYTVAQPFSEEFERYLRLVENDTA